MSQTHPVERPQGARAPQAPLCLPYTANLSQESGGRIGTGTPIQGVPEGYEVDTEQEGEGCPNTRGMVLTSLSTGLVVPLRCGRTTCVSYCLRANARNRSLGLAFARPERAVLLTDVGPEWSVIQARANRVRHDIARATGKPFEWAYSVEPNPSGDGRNHLHAWTHGAFVPVRLLSAIADRRGMGKFARVNRIRSVVGASQYGLKGLGYGMKGTEGDPAGYLRLNGRRLTHQSRGFFRDAGGGRVGVRAAESLARDALSSSAKDPGPWQVTRL